MSNQRTEVTVRLVIPEDAVNLAREAAMRKQSTRAAVEAAAPLIVAAELQRLAKGRMNLSPEELQDRAAELLAASQ
jgi:hypothetical protein